MTALDMLRRRLHNQHLAKQMFREPHQLVAWLGAVQAQDYAGAKWAVGQRLRATTEDALEKAFAEGTILRTHVMRPTWHFVAREDIRWMLTLTRPRVTAALASGDRTFGIDEAVRSRSNRVVARALRGGNMLTRAELAAVLRKAGIATDHPTRLAFLMAHAELAALTCSGAMQGKRHTYALLDERAPAAKDLPRDEALAELAGRYFVSHGPATLKDYVWWSGLTVADAKRSVEILSARLTREEVDGQTYWHSRSARPSQGGSFDAHLLPFYDEYVVGYADRRALCPVPPNNRRASMLLRSIVLIDGRFAGIWKRIFSTKAMALEVTPATRLGRSAKSAIVSAAERYGRFLGLPVIVTFSADRVEIA